MKSVPTSPYVFFGSTVIAAVIGGLVSPTATSLAASELASRSFASDSAAASIAASNAASIPASSATSAVASPVEDGAIDLECGSTTATRERAEAVSFSPLIFVAGTKVLVPKGTRWPDFRSLAGKTIAVTHGTTNAAAIRGLDAKFHLGVKLVESPDHEQSYKLLEEGAVDGFATDDILLAGLVARHKAQDKFAVAGELLSYEPYGIVYAHDDKPMEAVIDRAFRALVVGHEIDPLYDRWFRRRLPNGDRFAVPMSPQLENAWKAFATPIEPEPE